MGKLGNLLADQLAPRDSRPTYEWAREHVSTYPPLSKHGAFDVSGSRHFIGPFDALDDERTREVNVLKPVRGGGSLIGDVWCVSVIKRRPGPFMAIHQTDPDALMMWEDRQVKMLQGCLETRDLMPTGKWKWDQFQFTNGQPCYTGGPALSNLQSKAIQYMREEECWMWPQGRMTEAEARCGDYQRMESNKILRISQGGPPEGRTLNDDEWFRACQRATAHEWETQCLHCGKRFDPIFSGQRADGTFWGLTWNHHKLANGDWDIAKCVPTVRFECPHCGQPSTDSPRTKGEWNRLGDYRQIGDNDRKRVLFHWEAVIDFPWEELVFLWLDACNAFTRGNLKPKLQFYQKRRAMFKDEASLLRGGLHFHRATYEIQSSWPEEIARFMAIDRQADDTYWWTVRAWSASKSRRLGFGQAYGEKELVEIAAKFQVPKNRVIIDSGHEAKGQYGVYATCCRHGWIAGRGDKQQEYLHTLPRGRKVLRCFTTGWGKPNCLIPNAVYQQAPVLRFSKAHLNQLVQDMVDNGAWEEPMTPPTGESQEMFETYAEQMAARVKVFDPEKKITAWYESPNDHARDLANMQCLMALQLDLIPDPATEQQTGSEKT